MLPANGEVERPPGSGAKPPPAACARAGRCSVLGPSAVPQNPNGSSGRNEATAALYNILNFPPNYRTAVKSHLNHPLTRVRGQILTLWMLSYRLLG